jgi:hypothetical protein
MNMSKIPGCKRKRTKQEIREAKRKLIAEHYRKYDLNEIEEKIVKKANDRIWRLSKRASSTDWSEPIVEPVKIFEGFVAEVQMTKQYISDTYKEELCRPRGATEKEETLGGN